MLSQNTALTHFAQAFDTPVSLSTTDTVVELDWASFVLPSQWKTISLLPNNYLLHATLTSLGLYFGNAAGGTKPTKIIWSLGWSTDGVPSTPEIDSTLIYNVGSTTVGGTISSQYPVTTAFILNSSGNPYLRMRTDSGTCGVMVCTGSLILQG